MPYCFDKFCKTYGTVIENILFSATNVNKTHSQIPSSYNILCVNMAVHVLTENMYRILT